MRKTALLFVIAVCAYAANAQFTLRPQFGFENPLTKISYNNSTFYKADCRSACQSQLQAGVRADYQLKKGFAPFLGVFTHRSLVSYSFDDPKSGMTSYTATNGNLQVQFQAGLQYSSKPLLLSKKTTVSKAKTESASGSESRCYHSCQGGCHKRSTETLKAKPQSDLLSLRLQPLVGLGYVPSGKQDIESQNSATSVRYTYNAGNIKPQLVAGLGFEFANNTKRLFTLSVSYFKGLGTDAALFTSESFGKSITTSLRSKVSGWNAGIGIPVSFARKSTTAKTTSKPNNFHSGCGEYYRTRCGSYRRI